MLLKLFSIYWHARTIIKSSLDELLFLENVINKNQLMLLYLSKYCACMLNNFKIISELEIINKNARVGILFANVVSDRPTFSSRPVWFRNNLIRSNVSHVLP